ncbi:glycoside hydrolase family 68 protein [Fructobacillus evanidus]|uniref:glycoside hydrolase family 68 protein n=1 Tax=Fructobacillus evanidus TaxID=3064281 RepID=UPI002D9D14D4|nr:Glucan-binding domain (YG repeat) [Fructobacillus sp. LMG 32999]CAK1230867.1 Glucan-binding domain (YG repeat) [Fructobacillus sp. LMG 32999]
MVRKKLYKSGKMWVAAVLGTAFVTVGSVTVSADGGDATTQSVSTTQSAPTTTQSTPTSYSSYSDKSQDKTSSVDSSANTVTSNVDASSNNASSNSDISKAPTSYSNKDSSVTTNPIPNSHPDFDSTTAVKKYLQKGIKLYENSNSSTEKDTVSDNNVVILAQSDVQNGRVRVLLQDADTIYWVNQSDISDSPIVVNDDNGFGHYTRSDMNSIPEALKNKDVWAPNYDYDTLSKRLVGAVTHDDVTGKDVELNVWDSWPVENKDGSIADYHGYHLAVGLTAPVDWSHPWYYAKMGLFAQNISSSQTDITSWQYIGNLFNSFDEGANPDDPYLSKMLGEWSGSTVYLGNDSSTLRVLYTNFSSVGQVLTTAQISVLPKDNGDWNSGLVIDHSATTDHKSIFTGDGNMYQTISQSQNPSNAQVTTTVGDDFSLRDPHLVYDGDQAYITFESSTGLKSGYQGIDNLYNQAYFGTTGSDFDKEQYSLLNNKNKESYEQAYFANAALGFAKLDDNFNVSSVEKPLISANAVSDEMERPNLFEYQGKWYLFTDAHGYHMATDDKTIKSGNSGYINYMFGFVSDDGIQGHYRPLNGNGLVLVTDTPNDWSATSNYSYSFLVVKNADSTSNRFVVTSYLASRTFAPSFVIEINGDTTRVINDVVLDQGALDEQHTKVYEAKGLLDGKSSSTSTTTENKEDSSNTDSTNNAGTNNSSSNNGGTTPINPTDNGGNTNNGGTTPTTPTDNGGNNNTNNGGTTPTTPTDNGGNTNNGGTTPTTPTDNGGNNNTNNGGTTPTTPTDNGGNNNTNNGGTTPTTPTDKGGNNNTNNGGTTPTTPTDNGGNTNNGGTTPTTPTDNGGNNNTNNGGTTPTTPTDNAGNNTTNNNGGTTPTTPTDNGGNNTNNGGTTPTTPTDKGGNNTNNGGTTPTTPTDNGGNNNTNNGGMTPTTPTDKGGNNTNNGGTTPTTPTDNGGNNNTNNGGTTNNSGNTNNNGGTTTSTSPSNNNGVVMNNGGMASNASAHVANVNPVVQSPLALAQIQAAIATPRSNVSASTVNSSLQTNTSSAVPAANNDKGTEKKDTNKSNSSTTSRVEKKQSNSDSGHGISKFFNNIGSSIAKGFSAVGKAIGHAMAAIGHAISAVFDNIGKFFKQLF